MYKTIMATAKVNLRHLQVPYILSLILFGALTVQTLVFVILGHSGMNVQYQSNISAGSMLWILPLLAGIFIPARNFRRIINLGGKREGFFWGSLAAHAILAAIVSFAGMVIFFAFDRPIIRTEMFSSFYPINREYFVFDYPGHVGGIANLLDVFGWWQNGVIVAFLQQFALLFLIATFTHTLTAIQDKWYGWVTSVLLVAIISVFTPIASLRASLVWFFNLIIFHDSAWLQICACIAIGFGIFMINKPILTRKAV